jgi:hypothetical protein
LLLQGGSEIALFGASPWGFKNYHNPAFVCKNKSYRIHHPPDIYSDHIRQGLPTQLFSAFSIRQN